MIIFWGDLVNYFITWPFFLPLSRAKKTCKINMFPSSFNTKRPNSSLCIKSVFFKHIVADLKVAPHCSHDVLLSLTGDRHCHLWAKKKLFPWLSIIFSSVRSSNSHPDLLLTHQHHHPTFSDLACRPLYNNIGFSLSEPLQLYEKQSLDSCAGYTYTLCER